MFSPSTGRSGHDSLLRPCLRPLLVVVLALAAIPGMAEPIAYIPNAGSNTVSVLDAGVVVATVPVGNTPFGVAVSPDETEVYITNLGGNTVSVIDTSSRQVVATIAVGSAPYGVVFAPDGSRAYVSNFGTSNVSVINTANRTLTGSFNFGFTPYGLALSPDGTRLYVGNRGDNTLSVVNTASLSVVQTILGFDDPGQLAVSPDGSRVYVANQFGGVSVISVATNVRTQIPIPGDRSGGIALSVDGTRGYVTSFFGNLYVLDLTTDTLAATVALPGSAEGVDVTPDGAQVYVTSDSDSGVFVIDTATNRLEASIPVGPAPFAFGNFFASTGQVATGVTLGAVPSRVATYAQEILASPGAPVVLANPAGVINLTMPLGYSFSAGEVRYARIECPGMLFRADNTAAYTGRGSASLGAINGLSTSAIHLSVTANGAGVVAGGSLTISGTRQITGTDSVNCTYGLYDFPSQAAAGGSDGRVATVTGAYLDFAPSTVFTTTPRESVADVEADPSYSGFTNAFPTRPTTAALSRLTYALSASVRRKANGNAIALVDLHATGANGTRILVDGDFSAAANPDGTFAGAALSRVYLSTSNTQCTFGTAAASLSATRATFNVGATATDRMLCLAPLAGRAIPASDYTATLDAVPAAPTVYAVDDIGPRDAGSIVRDGTQLQAPLVQVPNGWLSRIALTNTGGIARTYSIQVLGESGNTITAGGTLTGTVPAKGTRVIDLRGNVLSAFTRQPRATLVVNVAGPSTQIQGLYQIVNPQSGSISNHVMVRPGSN